MAGNVELTMTLKDAQLVLGLVKQAREMEKNESAIRKNTKASSEWAQGLKNVQAAAKEASQASFSAGMSKLAEMNAAIEANKKLRDAFVNTKAAIAKGSADPFAAGLARMAPKPDYMAMQREKTRAAMLEERHQKKARDAEFFTQVAAANQKLADGLAFTNAQTTKLSKGFLGVKLSGTQAIGAEMLHSALAYAGGIVSITAAVQLGKMAWEEYDAATKKALASLRETEKVSRSLSQLAKTPEELAGLHKERDDLSRKYGISDQQKVIDTMFAAESAGLTDAEREAALKSFRLGSDPEDSAKLMGVVKQTYDASEITPEQALNVSLAASKDSPALEMRHMTEHMPLIMNPADALGLSYEESAAMYAETAGRLGGAEKGADRIKGLLGKLAGFERFRGKGMKGIDEFLKMSEEEQKEFIKDDLERKEAVRAVTPEWEDIKKAAERYKGVAKATGTKGDELNQQLGIHFSSKENTTAFELDQKEIDLDIARRKNLAGAEGEREKAALEEAARMEKEGVSFSERTGAFVGRGLAYYTKRSPDYIRAASEAGRLVGKGIGQGGVLTRDQFDEAYYGLRDRTAEQEALKLSGGSAGNTFDSHQLTRQTQLLEDIKTILAGGKPSTERPRPPLARFGPNPAPERK